jgi:hypothetical protein
VACIGNRRGAQRVFVGKPHNNISRGRPRRRWEDNIKECLQELGWGSSNVLLWLRIRDRWQALMNAAMNLRIP